MDEVKALDRLILASECSEPLRQAADAELAAMRAQITAMQGVVDAAEGLDREFDNKDVWLLRDALHALAALDAARGTA